LAASTELETIPRNAIESLLALKLNHYRIDVQPSASEWLEKFKHDLKASIDLKLALEIALHIADPKDIDNFCASVTEHHPAIARIILLSVDHPATTQEIIDHADRLRRHFPNVEIGGGTDYNYRELNCNLFDASNLDFVSYCVDPQEHATDDLTIIENIAAQADTIHSARDLYGESKPVSITSLTLKKRFNPAATVSKDRVLTTAQRADPRQKTAFAAAFTLGSIKMMAQCDANSVTLFQTVGSQGILSGKGEKYPVYNVLSEILSAGTELVHTTSDQPLQADGILLQKNAELKLFLVNYTSATKDVVFGKRFFTLQPYEIRVESI
ncbi:MAG TPA: hypothetical protein VFZ52_25020, partial [Chryseolinea sp.]